MGENERSVLPNNAAPVATCQDGTFYLLDWPRSAGSTGVEFAGAGQWSTSPSRCPLGQALRTTSKASDDKTERSVVEWAHGVERY